MKVWSNGKSMKINENQWKWKSMKINGNQWTSIEINENQWKSMKINENQEVSNRYVRLHGSIGFVMKFEWEYGAMDGTKSGATDMSDYMDPSVS